jgi:hypothetical protein
MEVVFRFGYLTQTGYGFSVIVYIVMVRSRSTRSSGQCQIVPPPDDLRGKGGGGFPISLK